MTQHLVAILALGLLCAGWFVVQRVLGGEEGCENPWGCGGCEGKRSGEGCAKKD